MKRLLLLFIPLMFFFGCEPDGEDAQAIVGVWKDDFDSNLIINLSEGNCGEWITPDGTDAPIDPIYTYCLDTSYFEPNNYLLFHPNYVNASPFGFIDCSLGFPDSAPCSFNNGYTNDFIGGWGWYSEILTIYENNEWSYSLVSMCFNLEEPIGVVQESCGNATYPLDLDPLEITLAPIASSEPYSNIKEGTWVTEGGLLKLTSSDGVLYVFAYEFDGGILTLDQSLNGQEEYITDWEQ